jgi:hypothetical protein
MFVVEMDSKVRERRFRYVYLAPEKEVSTREEFFQCEIQWGSQFWRGLHDIKCICQLGLRYVLGNGKKIIFWLDVWVGKCLFKTRFNNIFEIFREQKWEVSKVLEGGGSICHLEGDLVITKFWSGKN